MLEFDGDDSVCVEEDKTILFWERYCHTREGAVTVLKRAGGGLHRILIKVEY